MLRLLLFACFFFDDLLSPVPSEDDAPPSSLELEDSVEDLLGDLVVPDRLRDGGLDTLDSDLEELDSRLLDLLDIVFDFEGPAEGSSLFSTVAGSERGLGSFPEALALGDNAEAKFASGSKPGGQYRMRRPLGCRGGGFELVPSVNNVALDGTGPFNPIGVGWTVCWRLRLRSKYLFTFKRVNALEQALVVGT